MKKRKDFPLAYRPLYGLTLQQAKDFLLKHELLDPRSTLRVTRIRVLGDDLYHTDLDPNRVNVWVENGVITGCDGVY